MPERLEKPDRPEPTPTPKPAKPTPTPEPKPEPDIEGERGGGDIDNIPPDVDTGPGVAKPGETTGK
jgi:hypothetical protein